MEAKFTKSVLAEHFGKRCIRSDHLRQLYAYLKAFERRWRRGAIDGIFLYAGSGAHINDVFLIDGFRVRVCTLDLGQDWQSIEEDLLWLLDEQ